MLPAKWAMASPIRSGRVRSWRISRSIRTTVSMLASVTRSMPLLVHLGSQTVQCQPDYGPDERQLAGTYSGAGGSGRGCVEDAIHGVGLRRGAGRSDLSRPGL